MVALVNLSSPVSEHAHPLNAAISFYSFHHKASLCLRTFVHAISSSWNTLSYHSLTPTSPYSFVTSQINVTSLGEVFPHHPVTPSNRPGLSIHTPREHHVPPLYGTHSGNFAQTTLMISFVSAPCFFPLLHPAPVNVPAT